MKVHVYKDVGQGMQLLIEPGTRTGLPLVLVQGLTKDELKVRVGEELTRLEGLVAQMRGVELRT